jgi:hypothetical protein
VGAFAVMAVLPVFHNWREHDRRGFFVARDYAYNMLVALEPDAIIFTNGDNDTFPLWYLQEVEGVRKDVRVVNLSLLNTRVLRQVRLRTTGALGLATRDHRPRPVRDEATGRVLYVKDLAVEAILAAARRDRPLYLAVTVPDLMGLDERLTMEGLARRITPEPPSLRVDVETCQRTVASVFTPPAAS